MPGSLRALGRCTALPRACTAAHRADDTRADFVLHIGQYIPEAGCMSITHAPTSTTGDDLWESGSASRLCGAVISGCLNKGPDNLCGALPLPVRRLLMTDHSARGGPIKEQ